MDQSSTNPMYNPDTTIFKYADTYYRVLQTGEPEEVRTHRELLYGQLSAYRGFLDEQRLREYSGTPLQKTIHYASTFAKTYLNEGDYSAAEAVAAIRQDMTEEKRRLPYGVAEWIVHMHTTDSPDDYDIEGTPSEG